MDDAVFECPNRCFDKAGLIQGVGVNGNLYIHLVGHSQTVIDRTRSGAPIFV